MSLVISLRPRQGLQSARPQHVPTLFDSRWGNVDLTSLPESKATEGTKPVERTWSRNLITEIIRHRAVLDAKNLALSPEALKERVHVLLDRPELAKPYAVFGLRGIIQYMRAQPLWHKNPAGAWDSATSVTDAELFLKYGTASFDIPTRPWSSRPESKV